MTPNKCICPDPSQHRPDAAFSVSHQHSTTSYSCDVSLTLARSHVISGVEASYQIDYQAFECSSEDSYDFYGICIGKETDKFGPRCKEFLARITSIREGEEYEHDPINEHGFKNGMWSAPTALPC